MNKLASNGISIDVIVTSPPYNLNKRYRSYKDNRKRKDYLSWLSDIAVTSQKILRKEASFFLNIAGAPSDSLLPLEVAKVFFDSGFKLQNTIHWIKSVSMEKEDLAKTWPFSPAQNISIGHFKPIISRRFLNDFHEYIFHFTRGGNVWFIPYPTIRKERAHPAVFPHRLPYLCIKLHGIRKDMLIYDPFMGIGSTAIACILLGVDFIGTEIDCGYIQAAQESINCMVNDPHNLKPRHGVL